MRIEIVQDFISALKNARANGNIVLSLYIDIFKSNDENFVRFSKYLKCASRKDAFYNAFGVENNGESLDV